MNIKNLDLNLLVVFETIFKEQNLTRAGHVLSLSQPAMSHALGRLRKYFGDPLFIRKGKLMVPTPRAKSMYQNIRHALKKIKTTVEDRGETDPLKSSRTLQIGITNYSNFVIIPKLIRYLSDNTPGIRLSTHHLTLKQKTDQLENGTIDLVIGCSQFDRAGIKQQKLFSDREVCVMSRNSEIPGGMLTSYTIQQLNFIKLKLSEYEEINYIDKYKNRNISFSNSFSTDQELVIPKIVSETGLSGIIAEKIALQFKDMFSLNVYPLPDIDAGFDICQYWHIQNDRDPFHKWFRNLVKDLSKDL